MLRFLCFLLFKPAEGCRPSLKLSLFSELKAPYLSPHGAFEVVLGSRSEAETGEAKGYDGVSSEVVYGKVLDIGLISVRLSTS
jgi:hypothetical protein